MSSEEIIQQLGHGVLDEVKRTGEGYEAIYTTMQKKPAHKLTFADGQYRLEDLSPSLGRTSIGNTLDELFQQHFSNRTPFNDYELKKIITDFRKENMRWTPAQNSDVVYVPAGLLPGIFVPVTVDNQESLDRLEQVCSKLPGAPLVPVSNPGILLMRLFQRKGGVSIGAEFSHLRVFTCKLHSLRQALTMLFKNGCVSNGREYALMLQNNAMFSLAGNCVLLPGDPKDPEYLCFGYKTLEEGVSAETIGDQQMDEIKNLFVKNGFIFANGTNSVLSD